MARQRRKPREREQFITAEQVVADGVKQLRTRRGMTQQELADSLGWPQSTIARVELGERAISVNDLLALSWALDVAPGYLLAGSFQDDEVPVHQTLRVKPEHALSWIRGYEPLPGLDYRRFVENKPDREFFEQLRPGSGALIAAQYDEQEERLASGVETRNPLDSDEVAAERADERAARRRQLAATQKAGKRKGKSDG
jgi:transcriptional regulator with XRE-family HTH domain